MNSLKQRIEAAAKIYSPKDSIGDERYAFETGAKFGFAEAIRMLRSKDTPVVESEHDTFRLADWLQSQMDGSERG